MTWADQECRDDHELLRFAITGQGDEWNRLRQKIFGIIDVVAQRIQDSTEANPNTMNASSEAMKDLASLATKWACAKIERPSLENDKLRVEIANGFAEAKRKHAETMKIEAETRKINADVRKQELVSALDNLERLLKIAKIMSHITFKQIGNDGHLLIGPKTQQLGQPNGDNTLLDD